MPTIKIVPMPGVSVPGPQGPQGETGPAGADATFPSPTNWTPVMNTVNGDFVQTLNPATGTYMKYGRMVVVNLFIPFSQTTNFGTGQYVVTLPFTATFHQDVVAGSLHNTNASAHYTVKGHLNDGSNEMTIWYISGTSKDEPFTATSPISVATDDLFHMSFIYETNQ